MNYLLDTNVVSALRVPARNPEVASWVAGRPIQHLFTSALTIAEIERGVAKRERQDPHQAIALREWFEGQVLPAFAGRVLSFDLESARVLASYRVPEHAPLDDAMIAAVAQAHNMQLVTRNEKHFKPLGIRCINPWDTRA